MARPLPDPVLSPLDARDRALLRPCLKALCDLAYGRRRPTSDGQRMFLAAVRGKGRPVTPYEIAFLRWRRAGKPDLDQEPPAAVSPSAPEPSPPPGSALPPVSPVPPAAASAEAGERPFRKKKKKRRPAKWTGMSVEEAKKPRKPRYSEAEIARAHRISGLGRMTAKFVPGGKVSPR